MLTKTHMEREHTSIGDCCTSILYRPYLVVSVHSRWRRPSHSEGSLVVKYTRDLFIVMPALDSMPLITCSSSARLRSCSARQFCSNLAAVSNACYHKHFTQLYRFICPTKFANRCISTLERAIFEHSWVQRLMLRPSVEALHVHT